MAARGTGHAHEGLGGAIVVGACLVVGVHLATFHNLSSLDEVPRGGSAEAKYSAVGPKHIDRILHMAKQNLSRALVSLHRGPGHAERCFSRKTRPLALKG